MILFPFAKANATIQLFLRGKAQITVNAYTIIIINDLLMMALGYIVLKYYLKESKKAGSLSKFWRQLPWYGGKYFAVHDINLLETYGFI